jgi:amidase
VTDDLATLDATAQAELVRSGEASPAERVEVAIDRIEAGNGEINALITPLFETWAERFPDAFSVPSR